MSVAIRDGKPIISSGKIALSCGCCGCSACKPSQVSIAIQSNDFLRHSEWQQTGGAKYKESYGIIAAPLSNTFSLSLQSSSQPGMFPNSYRHVYASSEISHPGSGKIVVAFFNEVSFFGPGITGHLITVDIPIKVCRARNWKPYQPSAYKFYTLEEMLTPQYESSGGSTQLLIRSDVGYISTTFACTQQSGSSRTYTALAGNGDIGGRSDAQEGDSAPCVVWQFKPTTTQAIAAANAQGYGYVRHYEEDMYSWTEISRNDVTSGENVVRLQSIQHDCGE